MPWMSDRMATLSSDLIRPIAIPATGALIGTPASISARVLPQTEAWEVLPLEDSTSETRRIVYGNSSLLGITGSSALSASAPCPISLLPGPLIGLVSPTL